MHPLRSFVYFGLAYQHVWHGELCDEGDGSDARKDEDGGSAVERCLDRHTFVVPAYILAAAAEPASGSDAAKTR